MSFSFRVRAANKMAVMDAMRAEMAKVVESQPVHATDEAAVIATADAFTSALPVVAGKEIEVVAYGNVSWTSLDSVNSITNVIASNVDPK